MGVDSSVSVQTAFSGWYKQLQLEDDAAQVQARLAAVMDIAKSHSAPQVEALVRLAFATKRPAALTEVEKIRQVFTNADGNFPQNGNNAELKLLAGACLMQLMEQSPSLTALAIVNASCGGARKTKLAMDLVSRAHTVLENRSEINRLRKPVTTRFLDSKALDFSPLQKKIQDQPDWNVLVAAIAEMQVILKKSFADQAQQAQAALDAIGSNLQMKDEELDMLWWLIGGRSEELNCTFDAIPADAQPFVLATEVASLTTLLPGPASVKAILSRAGLKERKKIKLSTAVNAVTKEWMESHVRKEDYSPATTPIHFALHRRLEADGGDEWIANWASATGIAADFDTSALMLGQLFYRERLLLNWT